MADPSVAASPSLEELLIGKILDWPFLLFVLAMIVMYRSGQSFFELVRGRKLDVELGGNKLSIGDAVEALDGETKQALDDFRKHQEEIESLKRRLDAIDGGISTPAVPASREELLNQLVRSLKTPPPTSPLARPAPRSPEGSNGDQAKPPAEVAATAHASEESAESNRPQPHPTVVPDRREVAFQRMIRALASSKYRWRSIERLAIEAGVSEPEAHDILAEHHDEVVVGKAKSGRTIARLPDR